MLVAGNKCDMATEEQIAAFREYVEGEGYRFFPISAATRQGTEELVQAIAARLAELDGICDDFYVLGGGGVRGRYEHYEFARAVREAAASGIAEK